MIILSSETFGACMLVHDVFEKVLEMENSRIYLSGLKEHLTSIGNHDVINRTDPIFSAYELVPSDLSEIVKRELLCELSGTNYDGDGFFDTPEAAYEAYKKATKSFYTHVDRLP